MTALEERDLRISLPTGVVGRKFDDKTRHGLSHCMKAVDFIVELSDRIYFIEFKDPDHPRAKPEDRAAFIEELASGAIDNDLKIKFRDSWLYQYAEGRLQKPVYYLVLIAAKSLSEAELLARMDALQRQLPVLGPDNKPWKKPFAAGCAVMNIETWNKTFPQFPVSRVSA